MVPESGSSTDVSLTEFLWHIRYCSLLRLFSIPEQPSLLLLSRPGICRCPWAPPHAGPEFPLLACLVDSFSSRKTQRRFHLFCEAFLAFPSPLPTRASGSALLFQRLGAGVHSRGHAHHTAAGDAPAPSPVESNGTRRQTPERGGALETAGCLVATRDD